MESNEVLYAEDAIVTVNNGDLEWLKQKARLNSKQRIRLCSHPALTDILHEMLIVLKKQVYIQPHKHPGKSESLHIIEGVVDVVVFNDDGTIFQVLPLGEYGSGRIFYCRMNCSQHHTLLIRSEFLVFHETTNGPFHKGDTEYAPWSPAGSDIDSSKRYLEQLNMLVANFMRKKKEIV